MFWELKSGQIYAILRPVFSPNNKKNTAMDHSITVSLCVLLE